MKRYSLVLAVLFFLYATTALASGMGVFSGNATSVQDGLITNADVNPSAGIDAAKLGAGNVDNTELGHLNGVTSPIQTQLDGKRSNDNTAILLGKVNVISVSDNTTLTDAQGHGTLVFVAASKTITLPPVAAAGYSVCIQVIGAYVVDVKPDSTDGIILNGGTRDTNGDAIYSSGTTGDQVCLVSDSATGWTTTGRTGTWLAR